jgi:hypothetical protein
MRTGAVVRPLLKSFRAGFPSIEAVEVKSSTSSVICAGGRVQIGVKNMHVRFKYTDRSIENETDVGRVRIKSPCISNQPM